MPEEEAFRDGGARAESFPHRRMVSVETLYLAHFLIFCPSQRRSPQEEQLRVKSSHLEGSTSHQCGNKSRPIVPEESHADCGERHQKAENTKGQRGLGRSTGRSIVLEHDACHEISLLKATEAGITGSL